MSTENIDTNNPKIPYQRERRACYSVKNFEDIVASIYTELPFMGYILTSIKRRASNHISTACINDKGNLSYNQEFINNSTYVECKFILFHEIMHKMNDHFVRFEDICKLRLGKSLYEIGDMIKVDRTLPEHLLKEDIKQKIKSHVAFRKIHKVFNIGADLAINQIAEKKFNVRPPNLLYVDESNADLSMEGIAPMEFNREMEYYFDYLYDIPPIKTTKKDGDCNKKRRPTILDIINDMDMDDDHLEQLIDRIMNNDPTVSQNNNRAFKDKIRKAIDDQLKFEGRQPGSGSSFFDGIPVPDLNVKIKDNNLWKSVITNMFGSNKSADKNVTLRRPSRRDELNPFGRIRKKEGYENIILVDTSGSIIDYLDKFLGIIERGCTKYNSVCHIYLCTSTCYGIHKNVRTVLRSDIKFESGGTDLTDAQAAIMKDFPHVKHNVIVLTDGFTNWIQYGKDWIHPTTFVYSESHAVIDGGEFTKSLVIEG